MINELFTVKSLSDKATLLQTGAFKPADNLDEINISGLELFKVNQSLSYIFLYIVVQKVRQKLEWIP